MRMAAGLQRFVNKSGWYTFQVFGRGLRSVSGPRRIAVAGEVSQF